MNAITGLNANAVKSGSNWDVFPTNDNAHLSFQFYVVCTAKGGSKRVSPVYNFHVGCTASSLSATDNGGFDTSMTRRYVSYTAYREYYISDPNYNNPGYCSITNRELTTITGSAESRVMNDPSGARYWKYTNTNTEYGTFNMKVKTTFTGGYFFLSNQIVTGEIYC